MSLLFKKDNLKGHTPVYKLVLLLGRSGVCIDLVLERLKHLFVIKGRKL